MVVLPDDAAGDEMQFVDIGWSGSRFRFTGSETASNGRRLKTTSAGRNCSRDKLS